MLRLLGVIFIFLGSLGYGLAYGEQQKKRCKELINLELIFKMMQSEITYKKQPLPCACREIGRKLGGREGKILQNISDEMASGRGRSFGDIWEEQWRIYGESSSLEPSEKEILLGFSSFAGYADENMQQGILKQHEENIGRIRKRVEEEGGEKKKLVMTLSLSVGALLTILLL